MGASWDSVRSRRFAVHDDRRARRARLRQPVPLLPPLGARAAVGPVAGAVFVLRLHQLGRPANSHVSLVNFCHFICQINYF